MTKVTLREKAVRLRRKGFSYSAISSELGIGKGTLSSWLSHIPYEPNKQTIVAIGRARAAAGKAKNIQKSLSIQLAKAQAKDDIGTMTERDIFMLGLGIYIGEGTKSHNIIRVINSNPLILKLIIKWFKRTCGLTNENFKVRLHLYPDTHLAKSIYFWSKQLSLPTSQFYTPYIDIRNNKKAFKRGKLPFGTAHLTIVSHGKDEFGVQLARRINAWIEEVLV